LEKTPSVFLNILIPVNVECSLPRFKLLPLSFTSYSKNIHRRVIEAEGFNNSSSFKATDVSFNMKRSSNLVSPDVYH
jgi:hypothetical protein